MKKAASGQWLLDIWPDDTYILIPSYKSVDPLKRFINTLLESIPKDHIFVVDDASGDGTYEMCEDIGIECLRHKKNRGKGAALKTGFSHLLKTKNTRWILTMDADGQHAPSDINLFLKEARLYPSTGICIGARLMRLGIMPAARICSNRLTSAIMTLLAGKPIKDSQCGYRMYSAGLINSISIEYDRFEMESEVILKAAAKNFPVRFVPVQTLYLKGPSHISHLLDTLRWVRAVVRIWYAIHFKT
ncbi:MAG: glycosyltransferase family 2 protein [Chitinispirillales bacterium]|jgi:glycosyltransferase involved in cell wall biosynthesis|nr:glycosyltransferase family 2 protein [Chitinispirillales bacterium]